MAFDFAFGLRCRSIAQSDAIEMESSTELSESIRSVGEKERMIIYIECQRQAVESENPRQEVQVRQQSFSRRRWKQSSRVASLESPARLFCRLQPSDGAQVASPQSPILR